MSGKLSRVLARNIVTKKLKMTNARPLVTFTFDDAPGSACEAGASLLERYLARATYYISGGGCGAAGGNGRMATAGQVKALCMKGHEIGCHTYSHAAVTSLGGSALIAELERNRAFLQGIHADVTVRNFAYPYGFFSFGSKRYLEGRFDSCRSVRPGLNVGVADLGALKAWQLENASIDRPTILKIIAETVRRNAWLIFTSHDVDDDPTPFGVSPGLLEFALNAASEAGCRLVTVETALRILRATAALPAH
jgi:peptidoglycan/xylan/chitin deacetylase (PgdA/CDA1 family)